MLFLYRAYLPDNSGVFGKLLVDDWHCYTIERPWKQNQESESCIPEGIYRMGRRESNVVKRTTNSEFLWGWEIQDVPDRTYIMLHPANWPDDLEGCIGVGDRFFWTAKGPMVSHSRKTFRELMGMLSLRMAWDIDIQTKTIRYP